MIGKGNDNKEFLNCVKGKKLLCHSISPLREDNSKMVTNIEKAEVFHKSCWPIFGQKQHGILLSLFLSN